MTGTKLPVPPGALTTYQTQKERTLIEATETTEIGQLLILGTFQTIEGLMKLFSSLHLGKAIARGL